jgi:O-antigen/teichoic acid export membrane protein
MSCVSRVSQEDALKSRSGDEVYYTQSRIDLCASSLITFMIVALLIVPIYLLYNLVKDQDGKFDSHATGVCIAILLVCTLLFSIVLSGFTRAKRHEILGAAAAYVNTHIAEIFAVVLTEAGTVLSWWYSSGTCLAALTRGVVER